MLGFANAYTKELMTVVLTNNYRSTQPILDISKTLINKNEERLVKKIDGLSKELISSNTKINTLTNQPIMLRKKWRALPTRFLNCCNKILKQVKLQ